MRRRRMSESEGEGAWRAAVLSRDDDRCRLHHLGDCSGRLAAHHVVFKSRDRSRRLDVDNGAALCRRHHDWVHANSRVARERYGLAGHATDLVSRGRVVLEVIEPEGFTLTDLARAGHSEDSIAAMAVALAATRPRRPNA